MLGDGRGTKELEGGRNLKKLKKADELREDRMERAWRRDVRDKPRESMWSSEQHRLY